MRILIITDAWRPQVNGVVRTLANLGRELTALGHTVQFITPEGRRHVLLPGYKEIRLALLSPGSIGSEITAFAPDAIHIATEGTLGLAARAWCLRSGLPFTTGFHTRYPEFAEAIYGLPGAKQCLYAALRWFHRPSAGIMVPTPSIAKVLSSRGFGNIRVWSRGVDTALFHPHGRDGLDLPRPILLCAGRISAEKGLEDFLSLDVPGSKVVIGDGPLSLHYRAKYPKVHFTGYLHNGQYARALAAADVFVFPSRNDTFGLVMLEAMASGVPVAAYPVPGPIDVVRHGISGYLDENLAQAIRNALAIDRESCRSFAAAFTWSLVAQQFVGFLAPLSRLRCPAGRNSARRVETS